MLKLPFQKLRRGEHYHDNLPRNRNSVNLFSAYRSKKFAQAKHVIKAFKNKHCCSRSPTYIELPHFTLLLAEDSKEMYQDSKRTCVTIVLLINFLFDVALVAVVVF